MWENNMDDEALLWIMDFGHKRQFKVKNVLMMDLFLTNIAFHFTRH